MAITLAFLQNQWFKDPEAVQAMYDRHPEHRNQYIKRFLFMGCLTGKRLLDALGEDICNEIIWEEISTKIGSNAKSSFPADREHIRQAVIKFNPNIIIAFGRIAQDALLLTLNTISVKKPADHHLVLAPHPASRKDPMPELRLLKNTLICLSLGASYNIK